MAKSSKKRSTTTATLANSKGKAKATNLAPVAGSEEETEESEESSEEEAGGLGKKLLTKIAVPSIRSNATDSLARARISINRLNLSSPPIPLVFGQWNDRSVIDRHVKGLQSSFQTQGVRAFEMENMIPLVIRKDHLDSECLNAGSLNAAEAPFLKLSSEGLKAPSIKATGGRHRHKAVEQEEDRLSTEIKRLKGKVKGDDTTTQEEQDMDRAYRATIDTLSKEKDRVCTWGVVIYDEEVLLADGATLATALSRNEKKLQYAEGDGESLLMTFRSWRGLEGDKADEFLKSLGKNLNSSLAQVMNHQESREFLMALDDMQPHFQYTEPFTTTWLKRYIHGVSGGIVIYISLYGVMLWKSLLSQVKRSVMTDPQNLDPYLKALGQPTAERPDDWSRQAIITWKTMADPEYVAKLDVQYDMLSVAMMSRLHVDSALIRTLLTKTPNQAPSEWQQYQDIIREIYDTNIKYEPFDNEVKDDIGAKFLKKVEWFITDHKDSHYARPMPMLTPTVILEVNSMMQTIEPALIEFARWFDPYAEYFYQNHKNTETPKDLTAHMLRTISTNAGDIFNRPGKAARELAHIPLKYYAAFLKLTEDMKAFGPKIVRPRTPPEQKLDALEKKYKGIKQGVETLKKLMKDNKRSGLTGNWVLDFVGIYHWRNSSKIKNIGRDFIRWAIPAHVEVEIVDSYRRTLLKESQAAQYLRFIAAETLSPHVTPVNRINSAGSCVSSQRYLYPDQLQTMMSQPIAAPEVHVADLMERMKDDEDLTISLKELRRDVKKIAKLRCLAAKPDCTEMSPQVHSVLETFIQTATMNAHRLRDMKADLHEVDPLDEKWELRNYADVERIICDIPPVWLNESVGSKTIATNKVIISQDENSHNVDTKDRGSDVDDNDGHVDIKAGQTAASTKGKDNGSLNDDNEGNRVEATERNDKHDRDMDLDIILVEAEAIEGGQNSPAVVLHSTSPSVQSYPELRQLFPGDSLRQTLVQSQCDAIIPDQAAPTTRTRRPTQGSFISEQFTGQKRRNLESDMPVRSAKKFHHGNELNHGEIEEPLPTARSGRLYRKH